MTLKKESSSVRPSSKESKTPSAIVIQNDPKNNNNQNHNNNNNHDSSLTCFICAEHRPRYWAIMPCQHKVCATCSVRWRALYENQTCPWCKVVHPYVRITSDPEKSGNEQPSSSLIVDTKHGMTFESSLCKRQVLDENLQVRCVKCTTSTSTKNQPVMSTKFDLKRHVQTMHQGSFMCDICVGHRRCFPHELDIFDSKSTLQAHQRISHPRCPVCQNHFYSEDELLQHCRERHELCHLCQRRQILQQRQRSSSPSATTTSSSVLLNCYHANFEQLEEHFRRDHYVCQHPACVEAKFVAFDTELEYKAHLATVHPNYDPSLGSTMASGEKMQRSQQRQLRRLDVAFGTNDVSPPTSNTTPPRNTTHSIPTINRPYLPVVPAPSTQPRDWSSFFFPQANNNEMVNEQSWHLQYQRNQEFSRQLLENRLPEAAIKDICRQFQANNLDAKDITFNIYQLIPDLSQLETVWVPKLLELQGDPIRKRQLDQAFHTLISRVKAFPPLPSRIPPNFAKSNSDRLLDGNVTQKTPFKGRIVYSKPSASMIAKGDPTRNPAALLPGGSISRLTSSKDDVVDRRSSDKGKKKSPSPTTMKYATALTGLHPSEATHGDEKDQSKRDERDFPTLANDNNKKQGRHHEDDMEMPTELQEESFVIGSHHHKGEGKGREDFNQQTSKKKEKKKWQSVLHIGL